MQLTDTKPIRVLLVDDHQLLTGALSQMMSREPDLRVVGVAGSVAEAKTMSRERVDVVLMDYRLPDGTGAEATRAIKARWPAASRRVTRRARPISSANVPGSSCLRTARTSKPRSSSRSSPVRAEGVRCR